MPIARGVRVPRSEAEQTRRRLQALGVLRLDLAVAHAGDDVVFPVTESCGPTLPTTSHEFEARSVRPTSYQEHLRWPADLVAQAPRAFDQLGDIVLVKIPDSLWDRAAGLGAALQEFTQSRAVFADRGVKGDFRVRDLVRIAGAGDALTSVMENGVRLWVDPAIAYYSPRLASERERVVALVRPGEHFVDLFAGVGPLAVQAARAGAQVDAVDANPEATKLARRNARENRVQGRMAVHDGDARAVAAGLAPADRVAMNLPHGAWAFLDVAAGLAKPGAVVHYHEILRADAVDDRVQAVEARFAALGRRPSGVSHRVVRHYSPAEDHVVVDLRL